MFSTHTATISSRLADATYDAAEISNVTFDELCGQITAQSLAAIYVGAIASLLQDIDSSD